MRTKHTFRLPPDLAGKLTDYAARKRVSQALVVEAALVSHLSPDGARPTGSGSGAATRPHEPQHRPARTSRHDLERSAGGLRAVLAHEHAAFARRGAASRPGQRARALPRLCRGAGPTACPRKVARRRSRVGLRRPSTAGGCSTEGRLRPRLAVCLSFYARTLRFPFACCASRPATLLNDPAHSSPSRRHCGAQRADHPLSNGSLRSRRAHVAHRARANNRELSRRSGHRRSHAEPRRPALDRP
jgi:hypothetical protein